LKTDLLDLITISKGTGEVLSETGQFIGSQAKEGAKDLQTIGTGVEIVGFAAAPFSGGASQSLVGVGQGLQIAGAAVEISFAVVEGNLTTEQGIKAASTFTFGQFSNQINKLPSIDWSGTSKGVLRLIWIFRRKPCH
jgi:hypothetical protein